MIDTIERLRRGASSAVAALVLASAAGAAAAQPLPTLRAEHMMRPQSIEARAFEAFAAEIERERMLRLDVSAASPDRPAASLIEAVRSRALDVAVVPANALGALGPPAHHFNAFGIPFLFRDQRDAMRVQLETHQFNLLRELQAARVEPLGWWPGETLVLMSRKPVLEPRDMRGLRVGSLASPGRGEASALPLFVDKLGAVAVPVPPRNAAAAFAQSGLDVLEAALTDLLAVPIENPSVTLTEHLYAGYVVIVQPARWAQLPQQLQDALRGRLQRAHDRTLERIRDATANARRDLAQKQNASIFPLPPKQASEWDAALRSERVTGPAGEDFVHRLRSQTSWASASLRGGERVISWNAWFEHGPENQPKDVDALEVNEVYRFYLDLARYAYGSLAAGADPHIARLLTGQGERRLLLQPVLLGPQLEIAPGSSLQPRMLTVQVGRAAETPQDTKLLEAFDKHELTTRALSQHLNLGAFASWEFKAKRVGCAGIAVAVWDQARVAPLDHIVLQVPVRAGGDGPQSCTSGDSAMSAGLQTMLAGPVPGADARLPDAALHVFEHRDDAGTHSQAVFIHRKRLLAAQADPLATDSGVYSWRLASALSSYVSDTGQMSELIESAHKAIGLPNSTFPFAEVASELRLKVFSGETQHDDAQAAKARSALLDAIEKAAEPMVVVRAVNASGATLFVPFGLLAAQASQPEVTKRFTVVQPLPNPRSTAESCIDNWYAARPAELQGVGGDARDLLRQAAQAKPADGIRVIDNHASLAAFLANSDGVAKSRGDGIIVLAHHDGGYLKFNDADHPPSRVASEYIKREFHPGSVAVLAACTASGDHPATRAIIERLANQGVDALVVSPFAVDAEFGTRLALEFEKVVAEERTKRSGATLLRVFERATSRVAAAYESQPAFSDMGLEFMVIGNPEIALCKVPEAR